MMINPLFIINKKGICLWGKRKWKKLSINDIEETIEGYQENWLEYTLIDANKFSKEKLLEDNLIISKAMLIEKSKNKEELNKNIEEKQKEMWKDKI